jgi:hypothetical protein
MSSKFGLITVVLLVASLGACFVSIQDVFKSEVDPIRLFQKVIASTKWSGYEKENDVTFVTAEKSGRQGVLRSIADKVHEPLKMDNEEDCNRWFRLFGGVKFMLGGSIPTALGLRTKDFYWRHTFDDESVGNSLLLLMAVNGDSIVYVKKNRVCWIRGESCSIVEAFDSIEGVARYFVFALAENQMIDSYSWEENAKTLQTTK